jgi:hypothetical protein
MTKNSFSSLALIKLNLLLAAFLDFSKRSRLRYQVCLLLRAL